MLRINPKIVAKRKRRARTAETLMALENPCASPEVEAIIVAFRGTRDPRWPVSKILP